MNLLKVGGVPEHFNYPWHVGIVNNAFGESSIELDFQEFHSGTGAMVKALETNELDVAVVLTEGIVNAIMNGNPARVLACYTASPLIWGIYTGPNSMHKHNIDIGLARVAISRFGSGSHLIASYFFKKQGRKLENHDFVVVSDMQGARGALANDKRLVFFWEKFTTQYLVHKGEFLLKNTCPTPWPGFMIAASAKAMQDKAASLTQMLACIRIQMKAVEQLPHVVHDLAVRYHMTNEEAKLWLNTVEWDFEGRINVPEILSQTQQVLIDLEINQNQKPEGSFIFAL